MSNDSGTGATKRTRRTATRNVEAGLSPDLRKHITEAARNIRAAHKAELADVGSADRAVQLFRSIISPRGKPTEHPLREAPERVAALAGELGGLLGDAIRAGTGLLGVPLTAVTQACVEAVLGPAATSEAGPSAAAPSSPPVQTAAPCSQAPEPPAANPEEETLRGVLRQFLPMLVTSLQQGGDGYGFAETVIMLFGRSTYDQASGLGKDKIMQIVKSEPDLWAQVAPIEAKFSKFLDEFTAYEA